LFEGVPDHLVPALCEWLGAQGVPVLRAAALRLRVPLWVATYAQGDHMRRGSDFYNAITGAADGKASKMLDAIDFAIHRYHA